MTSTEIIQTIKAEIERQEKQCPLDTYEGKHKLFILGYFKTFLSDLEKSEKPMQEELEAEIKKEMVKLPFFIRGKDQIAFARHFAEWGAEHLKK